MVLLGHLLGPEFIDSNISLLMSMTIKVSIYAVCGTFCRLLWVAINRGVVPGAGVVSPVFIGSAAILTLLPHIIPDINPILSTPSTNLGCPYKHTPGEP